MGIGLAVLIGLLWWPREGAAQAGTSGRRYVQTGLAALPGIGLQAGYVGPRSFFTVEAMFYVDASPSFGDGEGSLQVSGGLGGAIRPLGVVRTIGNANYSYDFDLGLRFGPSLFFATNATRSDKNQQFSLFLDPFIRFAWRLGSGRIIYVEVGGQRPVLRAGLWFSL